MSNWLWRFILSCFFLSFQTICAFSPTWTCQEMLKLKRVEDVHLSPDGQNVLFTEIKSIMEEEKSEYQETLYITSIHQPHSPKILMKNTCCCCPQWSPKGNQIAVIAPDAKGYRQIWLIDLKENTRQQITYVQGSVNSFKWSPNAQEIAFTFFDSPYLLEEKAKKEKNDAYVLDAHLKMNRLWVISRDQDLKNFIAEPFLLTPHHYSVTIFNSLMGGGGYNWSPDGSKIVAACTLNPKVEGWKESFLVEINVWNGHNKVVVSQSAEFSPVYSPDGQWIAYIASQAEPRWPLDFRVFVIKATGGKPYPLALTFDQLPSKIIGWSSDSQQVYVLENRRTSSCLLALSLDGKQQTCVSPEGIVFSDVHLNASQNLIGFNMETLYQPVEAYISSLNAFKPIQVSFVNEDVSSFFNPQTEMIKWNSIDGLEIEGLLTYPNGYKKGKIYPLILIVHGGPLSVFNQQFIATPSIYGPVAAFASQGYVVLRCNIRGSSGYGKDFRYANYQDWGGKDYEDLMTGVDYVIKLGLVDKERLGVMGWSYGGLMTSWIVSRTNRFKAAIIGAGISNCVSFNGTSDVPSLLPDYCGIDLKADPSLYLRHSPLFNMKEVSTPILIQHGEQDKRVPIGQSYELYQVLKQKSIPVQMVIYPRTTHYPQEPKLMLDLLNRRLDWFNQFLKPDKKSFKRPKKVHYWT